jgi:hypothetical protein
VLTLALLGRLYPSAYGWWFPVDIYGTQVVLWLFVLGWMAHRACSPAQKWAAVAAVLVLVPTFFGADALRTVIVVGGLLLLRVRPTLTVPRTVATVASAVASASLAIYLTHSGMLPLAGMGVPSVLVVAASVGVGVASSQVIGAAPRCAVVPGPRGGSARSTAGARGAVSEAERFLVQLPAT